MGSICRRAAAAALTAVAMSLTTPASADEGMWLLTSPPTATLKAKYGFEPSNAWLEHVQKSAVRFSTGGSGSLVSPDGLVMTNHHVGSDMLAKLSTPTSRLLETGFYARTKADELKCPDLELNVLWSIEDVTESVTGVVTEGMSSADANTARRKQMARIEGESQEKTGLLSQVVTLYQGGRYHLYRYRRYTDVRLVFAPEKAIAYFGGDASNFEYPRYDLDCCFFRIYENDKPLKAEHYLNWSKGSKEGDLALVAGHPGSTRRLFTTEHLKFLRDVENPTSLRYLWRAEVKLNNFRQRSPEQAHIGEEDYFGVTNSRKFYTGQIDGLQDPRLMARKAQAEQALRSAVAKNPQWQAEWGDAWEQIAKAEAGRRDWHARYYALSRGGPSGALFAAARDIVRLADELPKASGDRLREYRDSNLDSVYLELYSPAPVYEALEIEKLASGLAYLAETLGGDDPIVVAALAGVSPRDRAAELVKGSSLKDIEARKSLVAGGAAAVRASRDPMIQLALALDPESRAMRTRFENEVEAVERENYAKIAAAKFAIEGEKNYPDATFTLRLAFGPIKGYSDESEGTVEAYTTIGGAFRLAKERHGEADFELPQSWVTHKADLDMSTPFNFICTADIIGGNSGSPVVNTAGEVIGLIFDGNIHSLTAGVIYDDTKGRAVSVDSRVIIEALRKIYGAGTLADEIVKR
ncbi:MAG: S46 family peptidase [Phycisphaeraceae bacterium]|nr:S46 family peptidase [Phycisphaeraceae bacterium]